MKTVCLLFVTIVAVDALSLSSSRPELNIGDGSRSNNGQSGLELQKNAHQSRFFGISPNAGSDIGANEDVEESFFGNANRAGSNRLPFQNQNQICEKCGAHHEAIPKNLRNAELKTSGETNYNDCLVVRQFVAILQGGKTDQERRLIGKIQRKANAKRVTTEKYIIDLIRDNREKGNVDFSLYGSGSIPSPIAPLMHALTDTDNMFDVFDTAQGLPDTFNALSTVLGQC